MFGGFAEKGFGRSDIVLRPEHEVHCLTGPIDLLVELGPLATDLQTDLLKTPGPTCGYTKPIPALDELRRKALYPTNDRGVCQKQTTPGHHLDKATQKALVAKVPAHTQNNDLPIKMPTAKHLIQTFPPAHHRPPD